MKSSLVRFTVQLQKFLFKKLIVTHFIQKYNKIHILKSFYFTFKTFAERTTFAVSILLIRKCKLDCDNTFISNSHSFASLTRFLIFQLCDGDDNAFIATNELQKALEHVGFKLPNHKVRELLKDLKNNGKLEDSRGISKSLLKEVSLF